MRLGWQQETSSPWLNSGASGRSSLSARLDRERLRQLEKTLGNRCFGGIPMAWSILFHRAARSASCSGARAAYPARRGCRRGDLAGWPASAAQILLVRAETTS